MKTILIHTLACSILLAGLAVPTATALTDGGDPYCGGVFPAARCAIEPLCDGTIEPQSGPQYKCAPHYKSAK